jgi:hypothetical protein
VFLITVAKSFSSLMVNFTVDSPVKFLTETLASASALSLSLLISLTVISFKLMKANSFLRAVFKASLT